MYIDKSHFSLLLANIHVSDAYATINAVGHSALKHSSCRPRCVHTRCCIHLLGFLLNFRLMSLNVHVQCYERLPYVPGSRRRSKLPQQRNDVQLIDKQISQADKPKSSHNLKPVCWNAIRKEVNLIGLYM